MLKFIQNNGWCPGPAQSMQLWRLSGDQYFVMLVTWRRDEPTTTATISHTPRSTNINHVISSRPINSIRRWIWTLEPGADLDQLEKEAATLPTGPPNHCVLIESKILLLLVQGSKSYSLQQWNERNEKNIMTGPGLEPQKASAAAKLVVSHAHSTNSSAAYA